MTRICNKCEQELPLTAEFFQKNVNSKMGFTVRCKKCINASRPKSKKREKLKLDLDRGLRVCSKCSIEKDIGEFTHGGGSHRKDSTRSICKSCHNKTMREQRIANKSNDIEYHSIRENLNGARKRAREQSLDFNIEIEDLMPFPSHCEISGVELTYGQSDKKNGASLDKIIPSKGYTKGNVRIISSKVNMAKSNLTLAQLKNLIKYIEKHTKEMQ